MLHSWLTWWHVADFTCHCLPNYALDSAWVVMWLVKSERGQQMMSLNYYFPAVLHLESAHGSKTQGLSPCLADTVVCDVPEWHKCYRLFYVERIWASEAFHCVRALLWKFARWEICLAWCYLATSMQQVQVQGFYWSCFVNKVSQEGT